MASDKLTFISHTYDKMSTRFNLVDTKGGLISKLRYLNYSYVFPYINNMYYKFNTFGPPYHLFMKTYPELEKIP